MAGEASKLTEDLTTVPGIVGSLGLSIAAAQKAFNLDYLENLEKVIALAKSMLGQEGLEDNPEFENSRAFLKDMIQMLAPTRYQFTETTLSVKLDLAQTMSKSQQVALGINTGAVVVNAAMTTAYGYDYRAAAEVKTVIHATPPDKTAFNDLLERAKTLSDKALTLPAAATVDQKVIDTSERIFKSLLGEDAEPGEIKPGNTANDQT